MDFYSIRRHRNLEEMVKKTNRGHDIEASLRIKITNPQMKIMENTSGLVTAFF